MNEPVILTFDMALSVLGDILLAGCLGFTVVLVNSFYKNYWLRQKNTMIVGWILPAIALIITKVIASNFALSLGMIGALSIIRYRTPVKSNFELAILFGLITIGITVGVNPGLAIILTLFVCLIPLFVLFLQKVFPGFFLTLPYASFGRVECTLSGAYEEFTKITFPTNFVKSVDVSEPSAGQSKMFSVTGIFSNMQEANEYVSKLQSEHAIDSFSLREI